jgi:hypothetical protein
VLGLVQEQQLGPAHDAQRHIQPPALAAGELRAAAVPLVGEPDHLDHLVRVARIGVVRGDGADRLCDGQLGEVVDLLQHDPDPTWPWPVGLGLSKPGCPDRNLGIR